MSTIKEQIYKYIEDNIDLINSGKFIELYKKLNDVSEDLYHNAGLMTDMFYAAGINPLAYSDTIPDSFLVNSELTGFIVPEHIRHIENSAFYNTKLNNIIIPEGVVVIPYECFGESYMSWIQLPKSVKQIQLEAFPYDWMGPIRCYRGSYVEEYCKAHDINIEYID